MITGIGLTTLFVGISNGGQTGNVIIPLISLVSGVIVGELLRIDLALVLLDLKKPRMANFLLALVITLATALKIPIYPHIP